jgi:uncharacterized protein
MFQVRNFLWHVLAVFAWPKSSDRYNNISHFVEAFFSKFDQFQQPPRHPKWREVNLTAEVPGWTRFSAAQDWLTQQMAARTVNAASAATQARFNDFLARTKPGLSNKLTDAERESSFQQFITLDRQRSAAR